MNDVSLQRVLTEGLSEVKLRETKKKISINFFATKSLFAFLVLPNMNMLIAQLYGLECEMYLIFCKIIKNGSIILLATEDL